MCISDTPIVWIIFHAFTAHPFSPLWSIWLVISLFALLDLSQMKFFNSYATLKMYFAGGALDCSSLHVGQINPGALRGNHRHHTCNETFLIWGAETKFRVRLCNIYYCFYLPSITLNSNFCWYPKCRPRHQDI